MLKTKKGRIYAACLVLIFLGVFMLPVYGQSECEELYFTHMHETDCYEKREVNREADGSMRGETTATDVCNLCKAEHHYYLFRWTCSCGKSFERTGHACENSPYGKNVGTCSNYQKVGGTMHKHLEETCVCGMTQESNIAGIRIEHSTVQPTCENVHLSVVPILGENTQAVFSENGAGEIIVEKNGTYEISVSYMDRNINRSAVHSVTVSCIDKTAPTVNITKEPEKWTEGECTVRIEAYDPEGEGEIVSGIRAEGYSFDGGETWTKETEMRFGKSTKGKIMVTDEAGNVTTLPFQVKKIVKGSGNTPIAPPSTEVPVEVPTEKPSDEPQSEESESESPMKKEDATEDETEEVTERFSEETGIEEEPPKKEPVMIVKTENKESGQIKQTQQGVEVQVKKKQVTLLSHIMQPKYMLPISITGLLGLVLIPVIIYFLLATGNIGYMDSAGKEVLLGKVAIVWKKGKWNIRIHNSIISKCKSRKMVIYLPEWFARTFAYKRLLIKMPKGIQESFVEKRLTFLLLE